MKTWNKKLTIGLTLALIMALGVMIIALAYVGTDQADYSPGSVVHSVRRQPRRRRIRRKRGSPRGCDWPEWLHCSLRCHVPDENAAGPVQWSGMTGASGCQQLPLSQRRCIRLEQERDIYRRNKY